LTGGKLAAAKFSAAQKFVNSDWCIDMAVSIQGVNYIK